MWPSGWVWHGGEGTYYLQMICGLYAVLGIFLIAAARNPAENRSLISFTIWSSVVHAAIMAVQALSDSREYGHLVGDVPAPSPRGGRALVSFANKERRHRGSRLGVLPLLRSSRCTATSEQTPTGLAWRWDTRAASFNFGLLGTPFWRSEKLKLSLFSFAKPLASHAGNRGSNPLRGAKHLIQARPPLA